MTTDVQNGKLVLDLANMTEEEISAQAKAAMKAVRKARKEQAKQETQQELEDIVRAAIDRVIQSIYYDLGLDVTSMTLRAVESDEGGYVYKTNVKTRKSKTSPDQ